MWSSLARSLTLCAGIALVLTACQAAPAAPTPKPAAASPPASQAQGQTVMVASPVAGSPVPGEPGGLSAAQLRQALVAADALGDGWIELGVTDLGEQRYPAISGEFAGGGDELLTVELHDGRNGAPETVVRRLLEGEAVQSLTQAASPGHGTEGVSYRYQVNENGKLWYGEVVGWRQGSVVAAMKFESSKSDACVCDLGRRQQEKLAPTFR